MGRIALESGEGGNFSVKRTDIIILLKNYVCLIIIGLVLSQTAECGTELSGAASGIIGLKNLCHGGLRHAPFEAHFTDIGPGLKKGAVEGG